MRPVCAFMAYRAAAAVAHEWLLCSSRDCRPSLRARRLVGRPFAQATQCTCVAGAPLGLPGPKRVRAAPCRGRQLQRRRRSDWRPRCARPRLPPMARWRCVCASAGAACRAVTLRTSPYQCWSALRARCGCEGRSSPQGTPLLIDRNKSCGGLVHHTTTDDYILRRSIAACPAQVRAGVARPA